MLELVAIISMVALVSIAIAVVMIAYRVYNPLTRP